MIRFQHTGENPTQLSYTHTKRCSTCKFKLKCSDYGDTYLSLKCSEVNLTQSHSLNIVKSWNNRGVHLTTPPSNHIEKEKETRGSLRFFEKYIYFTNIFQLSHRIDFSSSHIFGDKDEDLFTTRMCFLVGLADIFQS